MNLSLVSTEAMELKEQEVSFDPTSVTIPTVIKDKVLLTPGVWNGMNFSKDQIIMGFNNTDWNDKKNYELIKDHSTSVDAFVGYVRNMRVNDEGVLLGDLEIWDEKMVKDLVLLKAKFGVSARIMGYQEGEDWMIDSFNNFSIVSTPACDNAYINLSKKQPKEMKVESSFISGYEFAKMKDVELTKKVEDKKIELSAETGSSDSKGSEISDAETNQKVKYKKKKKKKKKKDEEDLSSDSNSPSEKLLDRDEKEETEVNKDTMAEEEVKQQKEEVVEEKDNTEAELSKKLDLVLSKLDKFDALEKRVAELEAEEEQEKAEEVKAEEPAKEEPAKEEVAEEAKSEEPAEPSESEAELSKLRNEVAELKAKEDAPKAMTLATTEAKSKGHALLGTAYSASDARLAQVLLQNARE